MSRIYKRTDRIPVKIDDITIKIAPLSVDQKTEIQHHMIMGRAKGDVKEATKGMVLSLKYAIKAIEGVEDSNGQPYQLQFDGDVLTDECVEDLLNLEITNRLTLICANLVNGIPSEFTDERGNKLTGVELVKQSKEDVSSKNV